MASVTGRTPSFGSMKSWRFVAPVPRVHEEPDVEEQVVGVLEPVRLIGMAQLVSVISSALHSAAIISMRLRARQHISTFPFSHKGYASSEPAFAWRKSISLPLAYPLWEVLVNSQQPLLPTLWMWMEEDKERGQHQRDGAEQLDDDVQRWASGILERVANCIADHRRLMSQGFLA